MVRYSIHNNNIHYNKHNNTGLLAEMTYADRLKGYTLEHAKQNVNILWSAKLSSRIILYRETTSGKIVMRLMGYLVFLPEKLSALKTVKFMSSNDEQPFAGIMTGDREGFSVCLHEKIVCVGFIKDSIMYVAKKLLTGHEDSLVINYRRPTKIVDGFWDITFVMSY